MSGKYAGLDRAANLSRCKALALWHGRLRHLAPDGHNEWGRSTPLVHGPSQVVLV